jgi:hypothetical protein
VTPESFCDAQKAGNEHLSNAIEQFHWVPSFMRYGSGDFFADLVVGIKISLSKLTHFPLQTSSAAFLFFKKCNSLATTFIALFNK